MKKKINYDFIDGGVTAPKGFTAGAVCCGIKQGNKTKPDLALIKSEILCNAAGIFTKNLVKSAAVYKAMSALENGKAQGIIANSGNANCCNALETENAEKMAKYGASAMQISSDDVIVASTGVIGEVLNIEAVKKGAQELKGTLTIDGSAICAEAIMTTDTVKKEFAVSLEIGGKNVKIGVIAKGSGMIHINMGTMLSFATTDLKISSEMLRFALIDAAEDTYNMVSVDGDSSTNDTLVILANGLAENDEITEKNADYKLFVAALKGLFEKAAMAIAKDGEGATKLIVAKIDGAKTKNDAKKIAKAIVGSSLVKTAVFGADANWGRILCAIGYSGANLDFSNVDVYFKSAEGLVAVCKKSKGLIFSEEKAKEILLQDEIEILVDLHQGKKSAKAYGCDLTYDYVKINGDYRT